jgi:hypothetical protein
MVRVDPLDSSHRVSCRFQERSHWLLQLKLHAEPADRRRRQHGRCFSSADANPDPHADPYAVPLWRLLRRRHWLVRRGTGVMQSSSRSSAGSSRRVSRAASQSGRAICRTLARSV